MCPQPPWRSRDRASRGQPSQGRFRLLDQVRRTHTLPTTSSPLPLVRILYRPLRGMQMCRRSSMCRRNSAVANLLLRHRLLHIHQAIRRTHPASRFRSSMLISLSGSMRIWILAVSGTLRNPLLPARNRIHTSSSSRIPQAASRSLLRSPLEGVGVVKFILILPLVQLLVPTVSLFRLATVYLQVADMERRLEMRFLLLLAPVVRTVCLSHLVIIRLSAAAKGPALDHRLVRSWNRIMERTNRSRRCRHL